MTSPIGILCGPKSGVVGRALSAVLDLVLMVSRQRPTEDRPARAQVSQIATWPHVPHPDDGVARPTHVGRPV